MKTNDGGFDDGNSRRGSHSNSNSNKDNKDTNILTQSSLLDLASSGNLRALQRMRCAAHDCDDDNNDNDSPPWWLRWHATGTTDRNGSTPLHYAAGNGHADVCRFLLLGSRPGGIGIIGPSDDRNDDDDDSCSAAPAVVDVPSRRDGRTPLHWSARNGHMDVVKMLVEEFGANVTAVTAKGHVTPLQLAVWQGHTDVAKYLANAAEAETAAAMTTATPVGEKDRGRSTSSSSNSSIFHRNDWGCHLGHWLGKSPIYAEAAEAAAIAAALAATPTTTTINTADSRQSEAAVTATTTTTTTTTTTAASMSTAVTVPPPTDVVEDSPTLLVRKRLEELCEWLDAGVVVVSAATPDGTGGTSSCSSRRYWTCPNCHGQTPLHKAGFAGNLPVCEFLVFRKGGMLDDIRDRHGQTAADCAERGGHLKMATWLRRHASPVLDGAIRDLGLGQLGLGLLQLQGLEGEEGGQVEEGGRLDGEAGDAPHTTSSSSSSRRVPSLEEIRAAYKALAKEYHPDRQTRLRSRRSLADGQQQQQQHHHHQRQQHQYHQQQPDCTGDADVASDPCRRRRCWASIVEAHAILATWWLDPDESDVQLRRLSRQPYLQRVGLVRWHEDWHLSQSSGQEGTTVPSSSAFAAAAVSAHPAAACGANSFVTIGSVPQKCGDTGKAGMRPESRNPHDRDTASEGLASSPTQRTSSDTTDASSAGTGTTFTSPSHLGEAAWILLEHRLRGFELNLVRLLATMPQHRIKLSQLPKEYRKTWLTPSNIDDDGCNTRNDDGNNNNNNIQIPQYQGQVSSYDVPNPKHYKCKKLSQLLQRYCSDSVEVMVAPPPEEDGAAGAIGIYWVRLARGRRR